MKDLGIVEWLEYGRLKGIRKEWVFVWRLVAADEGLQAFLLVKCPVKETQFTVWYWKGAWNVDCAVEGKLDALDEMEGDGVFKSAS